MKSHSIDTQFEDFKQKKAVSKLRTETYLGINQGNGWRRKKLIASSGANMWKGLKGNGSVN